MQQMSINKIKKKKKKNYSEKRVKKGRKKYGNYILILAMDCDQYLRKAFARLEDLSAQIGQLKNYYRDFLQDFCITHHIYSKRIIKESLVLVFRTIKVFLSINYEKIFTFLCLQCILMQM